MPVPDSNGSASWHDVRPRFAGVAPDDFPLLHQNGAHPVQQDRWERLVSHVRIPAPAERVWTGLTDPEQVARWLAVCRGSWAVADAEATLDFGDGEFFLCRTLDVQPPGAGTGRLSYLWRWVGVGPATKVTWEIVPSGDGRATDVTAVEESFNPPSDWRSWNGMGWPGILDQLADYLRTGTTWRWPWRRMGPYVQAELPGSTFEVWSLLTSVSAAQFWLSRTSGTLEEGQNVGIILGDASGVATLTVHRHVEAYQQFPSYLPRLEFHLSRPGWPGELTGHLWIEPAGLGHSLVQVFHSGWEMFGGAEVPSLAERRILTGFWVGAMGRARQLCAGLFGARPAGPRPVAEADEANGVTAEAPRIDAGPHSWSR